MNGLFECEGGGGGGRVDIHVVKLAHFSLYVHVYTCTCFPAWLRGVIRCVVIIFAGFMSTVGIVLTL